MNTNDYIINNNCKHNGLIEFKLLSQVDIEYFCAQCHRPLGVLVIHRYNTALTEEQKETWK